MPLVSFKMLGRSHGLFRQPGYRPTGGMRRCRLPEVRACGEAGVHDLSESFIVNITFAVARAPRFALLPCVAAFPFVFSSLQALAQTQLPAVAVTATRTPTRIDRTVADTTVITREDIEQASGRTLAELLSRQPGLQFSSNGGLGKNSSINIRGLGSRHALLLVDGVRFNSATAGMPQLDNIPLDQIERIEIVRGPLSSLYGSDAVGGVVQIFTRKGQGPMRLNAAITAGSERYAKATAGLSFGEGPWSGAAQVSHVENAGFSTTNPRSSSFDPDRDGFRQNAGSARLGLKLGGDWQAGASVMQSYGKGRYDDGLGTDTRDKTLSQTASVDLSGSFAPGWRSTTRLARSSDEGTTLASASIYTDLGAIINVQQQLSHEQTIETAAGTVLLLAEHLKQKVSKAGTQYDVRQRTINGVGAGLNGSADGHTWQASLRHDRNSQFGNKTTGSLGYGFEFSPAWRLGGSYGTSFVAPNFNQLYWPGYSNPNLMPEEGKSAELNLRYAAAGHALRAALFDSRIRGYITSGPNPGNIPRTRIQGVSLSHDTQLAGWDLATSFDHVDPRNITPGRSHDKVLQRRARNALKASVDGDVGPLRVGTTLAAFSSRYDDENNTLFVGGHGTLDLRAEWRFQPDWSLGASLNNVGDKRYETVYGYNQPGRELYVTLRYAPK